MTSLSTSFHQLLEKHNVLHQPTKQISECFAQHPNLYKTALVVNHLFRAVAMTALCWVMPFSMPVNIGICFAGSLFYRLTVETHCTYKFALPAFAGSIAFPLANTAVDYTVSGIAFSCLGAFVETLMSALPLIAYLSYVVLTVNYDVDKC